MRFILADWGTSRFRAYLVEDGAILDRVSSDEGVSELSAGQHQGVFRRQAGHWLDREPDAPVMLVGMVGSREGWVTAPYATCPASAGDIAAALIAVDLGDGRQGYIVPGMSAAGPRRSPPIRTASTSGATPQSAMLANTAWASSTSCSGPGRRPWRAGCRPPGSAPTFRGS